MKEREVQDSMRSRPAWQQAASAWSAAAAEVSKSEGWAQSLPDLRALPGDRFDVETRSIHKRGRAECLGDRAQRQGSNPGIHFSETAIRAQGLTRRRPLQESQGCTIRRRAAN